MAKTKLNSERMKTDNPMFNKDFVDKRKSTIKEKYPEWGDFNIGIKRPGLRERNLKNNPMKNEEFKQKMISKKKGKSYKEQYGSIVGANKSDKHSKFMKRRWKDEQFRDKQRGLILKSLIKRPNKPEGIVLDLIKKNNLPFNYVGDGKVIIEGFNPDFLSKNPKHIIEVNGDYWHNLPWCIEKDKRKYATYDKLGYKTLIIWEHELKNPDKVVKNIIKFLGGKK